MRWRALIGVVAVVGIALTLHFKSASETDDKPTMPPITPRYVAAEGKVEAPPGAEVELGSELTARIKDFVVQEGAQVERGALIARLVSDDIEAQLHQAEAALRVAQAKLEEVAAGARHAEIEQAQAILQRTLAERELANKELKRTAALYQDKTVSQAALDQSDSGYKVSSARVEEAKKALELLRAGPRIETLALYKTEVAAAEANLRYFRTLLDKTQVVAPIKGILIERYLDVGEVLMPEKPLATIVDTDHLLINAEVDETDASRLHLGDPVDVSAYAYPGEKYRGRVKEIASYVGKREIRPNNPAVNLGLKIIQVKIELLQPTPLKLGMTVDVRIMGEGHSE